MSCRKKAAAQVILLAAGAAMLCFGVWRGEAATVLFAPTMMTARKSVVAIIIV